MVTATQSVTYATPVRAARLDWQRREFQGEPTVVLRCGGAGLEVADTGATVLSWSVERPDGEVVELADGYESADELREQESAAFAVMVPFSNRVRGARYSFAGVEHDLQPGVPEEERQIMHGLVRDVRWDLADVSTGTDDDGEPEARAALTTSIRPGDHDGYPFALDVRVTYVLGARSLAMELETANVGEGLAPVSLGWHPYFRLPGHDVVDGLQLRVDGRVGVVTDEANIPLDGAAAFEKVERPVSWMPIGEAEIDAAYFVPPENGIVSTMLRSPRTRDVLELLQYPQEAGLVHVFTGDTLPARRRASVAMEPVGLMTDAYNRPECADDLPLEPGATRRLRTGVAYRPGV